MSDDLSRKNRKVFTIFVAVVLGMVGMSFASVPLYKLFCQVTGYDGTPKIDPNAKADRILDQTIVVRFNTDTAGGMPWIFRPDTPAMEVKIGEKGFTSFYARNTSSKPIEGTAIFNVLPETAGVYFHKTQCFCFGRQVLQPGADAHMPVVFFVDPKIAEDPDLKDLKTITLSYTFFKADSEELDKALDSYYQQ